MPTYRVSFKDGGKTYELDVKVNGELNRIDVKSVEIYGIKRTGNVIISKLENDATRTGRVWE